MEGHMNQNNNPRIEEVLQEKDSEKQKEKYNQYVSNITPKSNRSQTVRKHFWWEEPSACWEKASTAFTNIWEMIKSWQDFTRHYR